MCKRPPSLWLGTTTVPCASILRTALACRLPRGWLQHWAGRKVPGDLRGGRGAGAGVQFCGAVSLWVVRLPLSKEVRSSEGLSEAKGARSTTATALGSGHLRAAVQSRTCRSSRRAGPRTAEGESPPLERDWHARPQMSPEPRQPGFPWSPSCRGRFIPPRHFQSQLSAGPLQGLKETFFQRTRTHSHVVHSSLLDNTTALHPVVASETHPRHVFLSCQHTALLRGTKQRRHAPVICHRNISCLSFGGDYWRDPSEFWNMVSFEYCIFTTRIQFHIQQNPRS